MQTVTGELTELQLKQKLDWLESESSEAINSITSLEIRVNALEVLTETHMSHDQATIGLLKICLELIALLKDRDARDYKKGETGQ